MEKYKMSKSDKIYGTAALSVVLGVHLVVGGMDATAQAPGYTAQSAFKLDRPAIMCKAKRAFTGEDPDEDIKITAALVEQGYFREDVPMVYNLQDALHTACERHGVPYPIALGLIEVESQFDTSAVNKRTGCYGLCQLSPLFFKSGLSPAENIEAGIGYLGELLDRYGDPAAALTAYHDGRDTGRRGYANAVLSAAERWES